MTQGPGASLPIGVYRGPAVDIAPIEAYEQFLGRQVNHVLAFMADSPSWSQFEAGALQGTTNGPAGKYVAGDWAPLLGARRLVLGVPACVQGTTWADEAAGKNAAHWTALARNLITAGLGNAVLRIAREFNTGYHWKVVEGGQAAHKAGWARIVTTMRAVPGAKFRFCWNPMLGVGNLTTHGAESCYPGDAVVDEIGVDVYDWNQKGIYPGNASAATTTAQQQVLDTDLTMWDSLRGWYSFALSHGKPLSFPEWGLLLWKSGSSYHGGGDNAVFVRAMGDLINGSSLGGWHAMWEDPWGAGVSDSDTKPGRPIPVPMARAAFLSAFGTTP